MKKLTIALTLILIGITSEAAIAQSKPIKGCFKGARYSKVIDGKRDCSVAPIGRNGTADGQARKISK